MTTQYQRGRDEGYRLGLRARGNAAGPAPMMRVPLSHSEFFAWWPEAATAQDLQTMKALFVVTMDAWIVAVSSKEQRLSAADAEYASWFTGAKQ